MLCSAKRLRKQKNSHKHFLFTPIINCIGVNKMKNYKKKFKSYQTLFNLLIVLFFVFYFAGFFVGHIYGFRLDEYLYLFTYLLFFLVLFISGPTIYAPSTSFLTVMLFGGILGCNLSALSLKVGIITFFFDILIGTLFVQYSAFVTLTAIKIFSPTLKTPALEGVMFKATRFVGIFNFRYIGSYILFFIFYSLILYLLLSFKGYILLFI